MFLLVQNDPHCPAGTCQTLLAASGLPFGTLAAYLGAEFPDPATLAGVIVLGGEMGANDTEKHPHLRRVLSFMERALEAKTPLLGICLGGQLLARVAGGGVSSPSMHREHGVCRVELTREGLLDPLFAGVATPFVTFQLHNDSFTPPPGAMLLASSAACPAQAFSLPNHVYGLQFHPEVDPAIVSCWDSFSTPKTDHLSGFLAAQAPFNASSHAIIANFIALARTSRLS